MALAMVLAFLLIIVVPDYFTVPLFVILWPTLFFSWPYLSRWLAFLKFSKAPAPPRPRPPATKRPLWLRLLRGTFVTVGKIGLGLFLLFLFAFGPLFVSYWQAQRARATVHVGMTAPEVLHAVTGWSGLQVISHLPDPDNAGINDTLAVSFGNSGDGAYSVYNFATRQSRDISEAEAIAIFQGKLHDGYGWHFLYTYNFFNQLVSFVVVFGPDGRVTQVSLVGHHWG